MKNSTFGLTWDQAQFERFSYILSNGYPQECNFQSETKIEPDLRLRLAPIVFHMSKEYLNHITCLSNT